MTAIANGLSLQIGAERIALHPERALEFPASRTLAIADVHWGKATALRAQGVPVPAGGTTADLQRLDRVLLRTQAAHLLVLGDLAHSAHGWDERALRPVVEWRARWPSLAVTLVRGNHDERAGDPPSALGIVCVDAPYRTGPFECRHEPVENATLAGRPGLQHGTSPDVCLTIAGHLHPTVRLAGRGRDRVRLPCFVLGETSLLLPAFSTFTGGGAWVPSVGERAFAIADDTVIEVLR